MKAYINREKSDFAICRIIRALSRYVLPELEIVDNKDDADLVVFHVSGRRDHIRRGIKRIKAENKDYAIIQYSLRSTQKSLTTEWLDIWEGAKVVWSYYDLNVLLEEDGNKLDFNFYHAPLGADADVFYPKSLDHHFTVFTTGQVYRGESVWEVVKAAKSLKKQVAHLGPELHTGVKCFTNINDEELNEVYNRCDYVSGLRRIEGFELPAVEGLFCGIRPILFDEPHYKRWYDGLAKFIPEGSREQVVNDLRVIFSGKVEPVTLEEIKEARKRFNWEKLVTEFWKRCL